MVTTDDTRSHRPQADEPLLVRLTRQLEAARGLDDWDRPLRLAATALNSSASRRAILQGRAIGHAVHPVLTDLPLGCWTAASLVDLVTGPEGRRPAERLTGIGLLAAAPTVVTGLSEWGETSAGNRRVGFVHALANVVAFGLYTGSWAARRGGRHSLGVALGVAGAGTAAAGGYLGSHLALARNVASRDPAFTEDPS
ncbi:MAG TPA: DUF2231 domain-containing protein [Nocardioidaceae bacterium]|nr:DUF2231 domain-containing protein [Nocardioidaceae bacterium]